MQLPGKTQVAIQSRSLRQEATEFVGNCFVFAEHDSSPHGLIRLALFSGVIGESTVIIPTSDGHSEIISHREILYC